jgi:N-acetylglucosaminyldiphosphoundecaprenol N-acetyl-beta-D-mannosaminyltransferase
MSASVDRRAPLDGAAERPMTVARDEHVVVCGVRITTVTKDEAVARMRNLVDAGGGRARAVYIVNAHTINLACDLPDFRDLLNAGDEVFGDGTGVRWAVRLQGGRMRDNLVGTDLIPYFFATPAGRSYRYYLVGGKDPIVGAAAEHVARAYGVTMAGSHHGHLTADEDAAVVEAINRSGADIVLVAMGNPVQERWIHEHRDLLRAKLCVGVGGLVDHWGGVLKRAPQWVRRFGLEWAQIMLQQPHKWRRYLIGNPKFMLRVRRQLRVDMRAGAGR